MRIGLSTCGKEVNEQLFWQYSHAGITEMELENGRQIYNHLDYVLLAQWAKQYDVNLWSYHLPFEPRHDIDLSKRELQKNTLPILSELIKRGSDVGIDIFVVHPSSEPIVDENRPELMKCAKDNLVTLAEVAKTCGAMIAVENLPRTCLGKNSEEILELTNVHSELKVCFDTNHLLCEDAPTFVRNVGEKIITIHVSDYDFINERHWLPGEGDINWQEVITALKEVNYRGPWLYELGLKPPATIERRQLELKDFVDNANVLFKGNIPPAVGRRKKNLGMWGVMEDE